MGTFWLELEGVTDVETLQDLKGQGKWESSRWQAEACNAELCDQKRDEVCSHVYRNYAERGRVSMRKLCENIEVSGGPL